MDYHSMKRTELQALCKQHGIPANTTNSVMAEKLSQLLRDEGRRTTRRPRACLKSSSETVEETEVMTRHAKKVRFSPANEEFEYELRSGKKRNVHVNEVKSRRKPKEKKIDEPIANDVDVVDSVNESRELPVRATRSSGKALTKDFVVPVNRKKQGKKVMEEVKEKSEIVKGIESTSVRVTRSKVQTSVESVVSVDENKQGRRTEKLVENADEAVKEIEVSQRSVTRSKGMDPNSHLQLKKTGNIGVAKDVVHVESSMGNVDHPIRVTRARAQTTKNDLNTVAHSSVEKRRARKELEVAGQSKKSSGISRDGDIHDLPKRKLLRGREVVIDDENDSEILKDGKRSNRNIDEVPENERHADKAWRRSSRNEKNVEETRVLNKNVRKVQVASDEKVTRSRAQFALNSAKGNNKTKRRTDVEGQGGSKMVRQALERADRRNGNRRKPCVPETEDSEVALHLMEPANHPAQKGRLRKSVVVKAEEHGVDTVDLARVPSRRSRRHSVLHQPIASTVDNVKSNKTIGQKRSKEQSGDHRSKKLRGEHIIEEPSETTYASVESTKRVTRGACRIERKTVINSSQKFATEVQQPSSSNTQIKRSGNQSAPAKNSVGRQQSGTGQALRSSVLRGSKSKRGVKLNMSPCRIEQSGSDKDRSGKSIIKDAEDVLSASREEASASRFRSFKADKSVKKTPVVKETPRRFTRGAVKSGSDAVGALCEKVDKTQQRSQLVGKRQPTEDTQMSSHEVADERHDLDTSGVNKHRSSKKRKKSTSNDEICSKTSDEAEDQILVKSEANDVVEVNEGSIRESAIVAEGINAVSGQAASPVELNEVSYGSVAAASAPVKSRFRMTKEEGIKIKSAGVGKSSRRVVRGAPKRTAALDLAENEVSFRNFEAEIPSTVDKSEIKGTPASVADAPEVATDEPLHRSPLTKENEHVFVKSAISNEAEVHVAVNSDATPFFKPEKPDANVKDIGMKTLGSMPVGLVINEGDKEPQVSARVTVASAGNDCEGTVEAKNVDAVTKYDAVISMNESSADGHASIEQSTLITKSHAMEYPCELPSSEDVPDAPVVVDDFTDDIPDAQNDTESKQEQSTSKGILQNPSMGGHESVHDGQRVVEDDGAHMQEMMGKPDVDHTRTNTNTVVLQSPELGQNDVADGSYHQKLNGEQPSTNEATSQNLASGEHSVELNGVSPKEQLVAQVRPAAGDDIFQGVALRGNDFRDCEVDAHEIKEDKESAGEDILSSPPLDTRDFVYNVVDVEHDLKPEEEPSTTKNKLQDRSVGEPDLSDFIVEELVPEPEPPVAPVSNDACQSPALCINDVEVVNVDARKGGESELERSTAKDFHCCSAMEEYDGDYSQKEAEYESVPSTSSTELEVPVMDKIDAVTPNEEFECESAPSTGANVLEPVFGCDDVDDECAGPSKELESEYKPPSDNDMLGTSTLEKLDVQDGGNVARNESEQVPSTGNNIPAFGEKFEKVDSQKGGEPEVEKSDAEDFPNSFAKEKHDGDNAQKDAEYEPVPSASSKECEVSVMEATVAVNANEDFVSESPPLTGANILEPVFGNDDLDNKGADTDNELGSLCKLPTNGDMLETLTLEKLDVEDGSTVARSELEQVPSNCNDGPAIGDSEDRVNVQNQYMSVVSEYLGRFTEREVEPLSHVADNEVPKGTSHSCALIGQSRLSPESQVLETSAEGGNDVTYGRLDTHEESILDSKKDSISQNTDHAEGEQILARVLDDPVSGTYPRSDDLLPVYNHDEIASVTESDTTRRDKSMDKTEEFFNLSEDSSIKTLFETQWVHEQLDGIEEAQETKECRPGRNDETGEERGVIVTDDIGTSMGDFVDQYFEVKVDPDRNLVSSDDQVNENKQDCLSTKLGGGLSETNSNMGDVDTDRGI